MGTCHFTDEFKRDAVAQITERGQPVKMFHNLKRKPARNELLSPVEFEPPQKMSQEGVQETRGY